MTRLNIGVFLSLAVFASVASCGGARNGPSEGNFIRPIMLEPCARAPQDGMTIEQRSLVAMVAAFGASRYEIHGVSADEYRVFTTFKEQRGMVMGWEAQVYDDGSVSLTLPSTTRCSPPRFWARYPDTAPMWAPPSTSSSAVPTLICAPGASASGTPSDESN